MSIASWIIRGNYHQTTEVSFEAYLKGLYVTLFYMSELVCAFSTKLLTSMSIVELCRQKAFS